MVSTFGPHKDLKMSDNIDLNEGYDMPSEEKSGERISRAIGKAIGNFIGDLFVMTACWIGITVVLVLLRISWELSGQWTEVILR